jgi:hypothetical protein
MRRIANAIALAATLTTFGCTQEKDRLDAEVRRLCALDGGVKVYEKVSLPSDRFDKYGIVSVPERGKATPADKYFYETKQDILVKGNPELWRWHATLQRREDLKVLGESVSYTRRGGDLPGPWHPSSFTCPENVGIVAVKRAVFTKAVDGHLK